MDLFSKTGEGIRNATTKAQEIRRERIRPPRYIGTDRVLLPYLLNESAGQELLKTIAQGLFRREYYIGQFQIEESFILISNLHILYISPIKGHPELTWFEPINS